MVLSFLSFIFRSSCVILLDQKTFEVLLKVDVTSLQSSDVPVGSLSLVLFLFLSVCLSVSLSLCLSVRMSVFCVRE